MLIVAVPSRLMPTDGGLQTAALGGEVHHQVLQEFGYRVVKTLGRGSYATVKLAYSDNDQSNVAVKIISKRDAPLDYIDKFLPREISIVKTLRHPNLIAFLQVIETNSRVYLIMEVATGGDLLTVIQEQKRIPEKQSAIWFRQMCDAIDYCHQRGVVHRDLKCENLLLDHKNNLKVIDFGFARADVKPAIDGQFDRSETYCGSYSYASPEVLMGIPYIPPLTDVWSMGVILYVMVIGRLPFEDTNIRRLVKLVLQGPTFPVQRESSQEFQELVTAILKRENFRPSIAEIRRSKWFTKKASRMF